MNAVATTDPEDLLRPPIGIGAPTDRRFGETLPLRRQLMPLAIPTSQSDQPIIDAQTVSTSNYRIPREPPLGLELFHPKPNREALTMSSVNNVPGKDT